MILSIAGHELKRMFTSPLGWILLAIVFVLTAIFGFMASLIRFMKEAPALGGLPSAPGVVDVVGTSTFGLAAFLMLITVPLMSMSLFASERRQGTLALLFSRPVSVTEIVLGKYLGLVFFLLIMVGLILLMPLSLASGTHLDYGKLFSGVLGLVLALSAFASAGLFMSTLTKEPIIAAVSSFGFLIFVWILALLGQGNFRAAPVMQYLSMVTHYSAMLRGMFNTADVIYYLLFILTFLVLSIRRLDAYRLQH